VETIGIFSDKSVPQIKFATGDVKTALEAKGFTVETFALSSFTSDYSNKKVVITLFSDASILKLAIAQGASSPGELGAQAYAIRTTKSSQKTYWVMGWDANGTMYGGLHLAENIQFNSFKGNYTSEESPTILNRGAKLNLPFDEKSPTYETNSKGTSYQMAIQQVWDISFWESWFDEMALKETLLFKGRTYLKKCWFEEYGLSEDLDFTSKQKELELTQNHLKFITKHMESNSEVKTHIPSLKPLRFQDKLTGYEALINLRAA